MHFVLYCPLYRALRNDLFSYMNKDCCQDIFSLLDYVDNIQTKYAVYLTFILNDSVYV